MTKGALQYGNLTRYDKLELYLASKANLKKYVFSEDLKRCSDLDFRMTRGKAFHSVEAGATKDLPQNYNRYIFPGGNSRKITSFESE